MTNKQLLRKSIHQRFLATALLPLLLITSLLTLYTIEVRRSDLSANLLRTGDTSSSYLATISDLPLYSRNLKALAETATSALHISDVAGIAFLDDNQAVVLRTGHVPDEILPDLTEQLIPLQTPQYIYFRKPVYLSGVEFNDYQEESLSEVDVQELVGWLVLVIDRTSMLEQQKNILITSALLFLIGLLIAAVFTYYLSLGLISPIQKLTATIKQMAGGNLKVRAETGTEDELAILAAGINQLAESVAEGKETLEHRIRFATRQLQDTLQSLQIKNQELELSRQTAETANQAKSDFLARMSHELRTPITSIQGFVRLLDMTKLAENDRQYCHIIDQAAMQLLTLIDDILAFSKLQSNTVELVIQPLDLAECVEQVTGMFTPQAQHKGLYLAVDFAADLPLDRIGDSIRIQQILGNLIANAIKFSDEGGIFISLKTNAQQAVIIEVKDTGIGVPKSAQNQLFNAFAQADTSISRRYGGTGLGLSIVKSLVDLMGGSICLESTEGKGSTFIIQLPLAISTPPRSWHLKPRRVIICGCHHFINQALIHAMSRFAIEDVRVVTLDELTAASATLNAGDSIIICTSALLTPDTDLASLILRLRDISPAKLILLAAQFNFYQQFNAKERAMLQPAAFLAMPPPLAELHCALNETNAPNIVAALAPCDDQILDGINILIAEDNQFTRLLLDTLLSRFGAYCTLADNGNEALAACQLDHFDLLLIDVHMPQKNGIETLATLRSSKNINANIPALALTADILQQEEQSLFKAGANGLLLKPLDEEKLLAQICELLHLGQPVTPVPSADVLDEIPPDLFRQEVQDLLERSRTALASGKVDELREEIHQLLGIAGVFKFTELELKVRKLHQLVKSGQLDQVEMLLAELDLDAEKIEL
ncbi:hybrid sensor histidine kinase/response regulator [Porticoccus sp.]